MTRFKFSCAGYFCFQNWFLHANKQLYNNSNKLIKQYYLPKGDQNVKIFNSNGKVVKTLNITKEKIVKVTGNKMISNYNMYQIGKDQYISSLPFRYVIEK